MFCHVLEHFGCAVNIDLVASRTNHQVPKNIAWWPDPKAIAVDAFTVSWHSLDFWCFPPVCIIPRVLQKIREDAATGLLLLPLWPTQPWFPVKMQLLINHPSALPCPQVTLYVPDAPGKVHTLRRQLPPLVCRLPSEHSQTVAYLTRLQTSCFPGDPQPKNSMATVIVW